MPTGVAAPVQVLEVGLELEAGLDAGVVPDAQAVPPQYLVHPRVGAPSLGRHHIGCQHLSEEEQHGRHRDHHL